MAHIPSQCTCRFASCSKQCLYLTLIDTLYMFLYVSVCCECIIIASKFVYHNILYCVTLTAVAVFVMTDYEMFFLIFSLTVSQHTHTSHTRTHIQHTHHRWWWTPRWLKWARIWVKPWESWEMDRGKDKDYWTFSTTMTLTVLGCHGHLEQTCQINKASLSPF